MLSTIGTRKLKPRDRAGTMLDGALTKRISLSIEKLIPGGVSVGEGTKVRVCRIPRGLRVGLARDTHGNVVLTPVLRAFDSLMEAVASGNGARVRTATSAFFQARCREMKQEFEKLEKPRTGQSAMLVGICGYHDDLFSGDNFNQGRISDLKPWQVGVSADTMRKLGLAAGSVVILSRFPVTAVIPVEVVEMPLEGNVIALPVGSCAIGERVLSSAKELGGDRDGDCYTVRSVHAETAQSELRQAFKRYWFGAEAMPPEETGYTWQDSTSEPADDEAVAYQKMLQKTAIGSITLDWYAGFVALQGAKNHGQETPLGYEEIRACMMDALESTFDLKHANGADPMTLHSLLLGMKSFAQSADCLKKQGMNLETIAGLVGLLDGGSVRDAALENMPYAIVHGRSEKNFNPVERFAKRVPAGKTLAEAFRAELFTFDSVRTDKECAI